ncbi:COX15/CtaA family protein [Catenovulum adriaticum]|uniref:COX15/CtaA family protein n=1 Tax=Catenovulum adriaticum TaxID=2984846 RepID=A0ABY7AKU2_9ALTE|nr:COX15/CtaA family protein [Catenovulum sp. TS8]WAJ69945.1 COX15/CtaA family protein [Catenovulum sp. TS8]
MKILVRIAIILAFVVVVLGAFTRLTDAGLGCPDWPGCYGHLTVPKAEQVNSAQAKFPQQIIEPQKAWNEMIHRYFAGTLGLIILAIAVLSIYKPHAQKVRVFSISLFFLVCFQAALGMWTVTLVLLPAVVLAHLIGGFSIFVLLVLLERALAYTAVTKTKLPKLAWLCFIVLLIQIILGGWTSTNYAALACTELPICEDGWQQRLDLNAFHLISPEADTYQYGVLDYSARMTIHIAHRIWAVITLFTLLGWAVFCFFQSQKRVSGFARLNIASASLIVLLATQVGLGIANVVLSLPLMVAVLHNAVALLLLTAFVLTLYYYSVAPVQSRAR